MNTEDTRLFWRISFKSRKPSGYKGSQKTPHLFPKEKKRFPKTGTSKATYIMTFRASRPEELLPLVKADGKTVELPRRIMSSGR